MNNFTKYICAGLAIALLIIQAIMIWGLYVHDNDCHELGYHCSPAFHPVPPEQKTE